MEWFEDWFDSPYYDLLYAHRDHEEAAQWIDVLMSHIPLPSKACILDLACGSGRHAIHLAKKGYRVTGLDLSMKNILQARSSAAMDAEFYVHDMRRPFRIRYYDLVLNLFTSFGYFDSDRDHIDTLKAVHTALKPNGLLVIDFLNVLPVIQQLPIKQQIERKGCLFDIEKWYENGRIIKRIDVTDQGVVHHYREVVHALQPLDFRRLLRLSGFEIEAWYGSYRLAPFDAAESDRLIVFARRVL